MIEKPQSVRVATEADAQALLWHTHELFKDNFMGLPFSVSKVMETVNSCCTGTAGIAGIIDGDDGFPVASTGIVTTKTNYSDVWILSEAWMFVTPNARKGNRYGSDLFQFSQWYREEMASQLGYEIPLEMSVYSFKRLKAKTRFWSRFGQHIGATFWVGPNREAPQLREVH